MTSDEMETKHALMSLGIPIMIYAYRRHGTMSLSAIISPYIHTHVYIPFRLSLVDVSRAFLIDFSLHWELHEKAFACLIPTRLAA